MSRQERTARRVRQAEVKVAEMVARVKCKCGAVGTRTELKAAGHPRTCATKVAEQEWVAKNAGSIAKLSAPQGRKATPPPASPSQAGTVDLAAECKRLRDGGMAWWLIGKTLGLPGAGDNAATGKSGAHHARRLYGQANGGAVPRTLAPRKGTKPKPEGPGRDGTKTDRKITLVTQGHVISPDIPDDEVVGMVAGNIIEWAIDLNALCGGGGRPEWIPQEARVHPTDVIIDEEPDKYGTRTLRFREFLGRDDHGRPISGPTRTVRVNAIHTIR